VVAKYLSVALGVLEEVQQELAALRRPSDLRRGGTRRVLGLRSAANATVEEAEGNRLLLDEDILEVALGFLEAHTPDRSSRHARVLEVNTQVAA
jgi:hypothetical protein